MERSTPPGLAADLRAVGIEVEDLWDLVNARRQYPQAVPILLEWLARVDTDVAAGSRSRVREGLVRALTVPAARPAAARPLIEEFRRVESSELGVRWVIGNALAVVADSSVFDELVELAREASYGRAREMLMLALAQTKHPRAAQVLMEFLDDEDIAGHAIKALRILGAREAAPAIERLLEHPKAWVRREAKKALESFAR